MFAVFVSEGSSWGVEGVELFMFSTYSLTLDEDDSVV